MKNIDYLFEIVEENKIEELIKCEIQNINIVDEFGYNLLMVAIVNEANETCKYLIEMGINLDFQVEKTAILTTLKRSILTSHFHLPKRTI